MKSTLDKKEGLSRTLKIEIPAEKVQDAYDRVYRGIQKNATIKGFRKGKAPLSTIRSMYADRIKQDVMEDLMSEAYQSALQEHSLDPIMYPKIIAGNLSEGAPFEFTAEFEVRPEVQIRKYENLKVQKEKLKLDEEKINQVLENIRLQYQETAPIFEDRPCQPGDLVKIDFEGFLLGSPLEGGRATDHVLEIGSQSFIPGFEDGLIGLKPGSEKQLHLRFPDDYHNKEVAGQPVTFNVKVKQILKKQLPDLNDELAAKVGEFKTLDALKEAIRQDITAREESRIFSDLRNRILKALVEANPVEVPESLKAEQKKRMMDDIRTRMAEQGMSEKDFVEYAQKWDADFEQSASMVVQSTFLVDALADKLQLRATEEDTQNRILEYARQLNLDPQRLKEYYSHNDRKANLRFQITEEKVLDYLIDKADVTLVDADQLSD